MQINVRIVWLAWTFIVIPITYIGWYLAILGIHKIFNNVSKSK